MNLRKPMDKLVINTDGGARGNPGPAGIGVVLKDQHGDVVLTRKACIGKATNNEAEYRALILALKEAQRLRAKTLHVYMDSELVVRQMNGQYKIKEPNLKDLAQTVLKLSRNFHQVHFHHIPREQNQEADRLVNEAIDEAAEN